MSDSNFPAWFRRRLLWAEMSQADFARAYQREVGLAHAPTGRVSEWASGKIVPDSKSCRAIADTFRIRLEEVLAAADHIPALSVDETGPKIDVIERARRLRWTESRARTALAMMNEWEKEDRESQAR